MLRKLFRPEGKRTAVTWRMTGQRNFIVKAVDPEQGETETMRFMIFVTR